MVRSYKPPNRISAHTKIVYKPKASCIVFSPEDRMHFAQFCALLITIDRQTKAKKEKALLDDSNQKYAIKIKGSQISGPYYLKSFLNFYAKNILIVLVFLINHPFRILMFLTFPRN